jgi:hypothetical protein
LLPCFGGQHAVQSIRDSIAARHDMW